jgi:hypothetical protein
MKAFYKGYEVRAGVTSLCHKVCNFLNLKPVALYWSCWNSNRLYQRAWRDPSG